MSQTSFDVEVRVQFKEGILDPQAEAIRTALSDLNFKGVQELRCDRVFYLKLESDSEANALESARKMAQELLANLVMEDFEVRIAS